MTVSPDPVRVLLRQHRALCERAIDPLEIAAGLEAHGVTDRAAARFRHRDVFSLAEELYARTPRAEDQPDTPVPGAPGADLAPRSRREWARWALRWGVLPLVPGALCAAALAVWGPGPARVVLAVGCGLMAVAAASLALRGLAGLCALPLLGYALFGETLLAEVLAGGHAGPVGAAGADPGATAFALALAVAPAAWCGRWFATSAGRCLARSRSLREFATGARTLLVAALMWYAAGLAAALLAGWILAPALAGPDAGRGTGTGGEPAAVAVAATAALGVLLFAAALLAAHGFGRLAATGLAAAVAVESLALATVSASWLPGCAVLGAPVTALTEAHGCAVVPALACGGVAAGLLLHAVRALAGASAHQRPPTDAPH